MQDENRTWEAAVQWLKRQPDMTELVKACYFDDPLEKSAERFYESPEWQAVKKLLHPLPPGRVLDVGAGRGISSYAFARDSWKVTALEPDESQLVGTGAIQQLRENHRNINIIGSICESLPFAKNSFDVIYGRAVLHHANNMENFCLEMHRVLKPHGLLVITREHVLTSHHDLQRFLEAHPLHSLYGGENAFELNTYINTLKRAGFVLNHVLGPYSSDINLHPRNHKEIQHKISQKFHIPLPEILLHKCFYPLLNFLENSPGRLYSFIGTKI